jgi:DNA-binding transcriptional ArsR family regulator
MAEPRKPDQAVRLYHLPPRDRTRLVVQGQDCVVALRALGEDTRVRIVGLLIDEALDVGEISKRLGVSPYNVSKHLRILREAGLLEVKKSGRARLYALPETIRGRAMEGSVLDLGCCSFQFQRAAQGASRFAPADPHGKCSGVQRSRPPGPIKHRAAR